MLLRSCFGWRSAALLAVFAGTGSAQAGWFSWQGTNPDYGTVDNWFDQTTMATATALPGATDDIQITSYVGVSPVVLDASRTHTNGQFLDTTIDLNGFDLKLTGSIEASAAIVQNGSVDWGFYSVTTAATNPSRLDTLTGSMDALSLASGATLDVVGSTLSTTGLYSFGNLRLQSSALTGSDSLLAGTATIESGSSLTLDAFGNTDIYASSLRTSTGTVSVLGTLSTRGATLGSWSDTGPTKVEVLSSGDWTDTSGLVKTIGFGSSGTLDVNGGTVKLLGDVNVGEGDIDGSSNGFDGDGTVLIRNGGSVEFGRVALGGWSRWGSLATGSGTIDVQGGSLTAEAITSVDVNNLGRGIGTIQIGPGSTANVGYVLGGAQNLDVGGKALQFSLLVNGGATYTGQSVELIGSAGKSVAATFRDTGTTVDLQMLRAFNGASFAVQNAGSLRISDVEVGGSGSTLAASGLIQGTPVHFESATGAFNSVVVTDGTMELKQLAPAVAADQSVTFQAGGLGDRMGLLKLDDVTFDAFGGLFAGQFDAASTGSGRFEVRDSDLRFHYGTLNGSTFNSTVGIGDTGPGSGLIQNSNVESFRVRLGLNAGGVADLVVRDSTVTSHADSYTATSPGGIIVGRDGTATVELFNSSLNAEIIYIGTNGLLKGDGFLNGDPLTSPGSSVVNHGTIAPGHSPGKLTIEGDLELTNTSVLEMEIDLANPSRYDQILSGGAVDLGGTLRLKALGTGTFDPSLSYTLLTGLSFTGGFANYEIDPVFGIDSSAFSFKGGSFGINPQAVPEPASLVAFGLGALGLLKRRKKV